MGHKFLYSQQAEAWNSVNLVDLDTLIIAQPVLGQSLPVSPKQRISSAPFPPHFHRALFFHPIHFCYYSSSVALVYLCFRYN
ncbi:hypothetical protein P879_11636 [Paragonimus westermani]|uniref:Uncharacterized protein n=1 Tax=Paragonimus westermani TaxID=34504 RepID=A0A8T0D7F4_9TREM|nr:hypothetical protein P879_11636 [Paragonimus westermani]